jgi:SAM-dependent methyltransferase
LGGLACSLCRKEVIPISIGDRYFKKCTQCFLIQKPSEDFPNRVQEKEHYLHHRNSPQDQGYVKFLNRAIQPLFPFLKAGMHALDYGCGPGPAMDHILKEFGISCDNFDPIFFPDGIKRGQYDLITATECVEHFHNPGQEFEKIMAILKSGGFLTIMTEIYKNEEQFTNWYYLNDPTHISFYKSETMVWIGKNFGLHLIHTDNHRVFVFQKNQ